jgi:RimJ/RimL family protein N-acetyltransferase
LFVHDADDRLVEVNTIERRPAPRLYLGRTLEGNIWRFRRDLSGDLVSELEAILAREPVPADLEEQATTIRKLFSMLARVERVQSYWEGPAWVFPEEIPAPADLRPQRVMPETEIPDAHVRWLVDELEHWQPCFVILREGRIVSYCHSSRLTPVAAEAGVETDADHRGRGYGTAVVAAWAGAVREQGRIPLYSTSWDNDASRRLARKLGLRLYGTDLHFA